MADVDPRAWAELGFVAPVELSLQAGESRLART